MRRWKMTRPGTNSLNFNDFSTSKWQLKKKLVSHLQLKILVIFYLNLKW